MLAYGAPGHLEESGDLPRGELGLGDEPQDGTAAGLGERAQRLVYLLFPGIGRLSAAYQAEELLDGERDDGERSADPDRLEIQ